MVFKMKPKSPILKEVKVGMSRRTYPTAMAERKNYKGSFEEAFANAKKQGLKEFTYKNKVYTTETK